MGDDPPTAVLDWRVSLAGSDCLLYPQERGWLPVLRSPGRPRGVAEPKQAARWGRIAVYVAMMAPVLYAITRFAWALGFTMGRSAETLRRGQEDGTWISGLFLAAFGLVGGVLMLGLVQRWGRCSRAG